MLIKKMNDVGDESSKLKLSCRLLHPRLFPIKIYKTQHIKNDTNWEYWEAGLEGLSLGHVSPISVGNIA